MKPEILPVLEPIRTPEKNLSVKHVQLIWIYNEILYVHCNGHCVVDARTYGLFLYLFRKSSIWTFLVIWHGAAATRKIWDWPDRIFLSGTGWLPDCVNTRKWSKYTKMIELAHEIFWQRKIAKFGYIFFFSTIKTNQAREYRTDLCNAYFYYTGDWEAPAFPYECFGIFFWYVLIK